MNKKLLSWLLCGVMATGSLTAFVACDNPSPSPAGKEPPAPTAEELAGAEGLECSETFKGKLSDTAYATPAEAVNAFVANELSSESNPLTIEDYQTKKLSSSEINLLSLPADVKGKVPSVEEVTVYYTSSKKTKAMSAAKRDVESYNFYLVYTDNQTFYFAITPKTGERLNKSYFDSLDPLEQCTSATLSGTMITTTDVVSSEMNTHGITTNNISIKTTETGCYYVSDIISITDNGSDSYTLHMYAPLKDGEFTDVYTSENGIDWKKDTEETIAPDDFIYSDDFLGPNVDYSCFEKTSTGFRLNMELYFNLSGISLDGESKEKSYMYFYVSNGAIVRASGTIDFSMCQDIYGEIFNIYSSTSYSINFTDFGTTTLDGLTLPTD